MLAKLSASGHSAFELAHLVVAQLHCDTLTPTDQGQADCPVSFPKREDAGIVIGKCRLEPFDGLAFELCSFSIGSNSCTSPDCQVSRKTKLFSEVLVDQGLKGWLVGYLGWNRLVGVVAGIRKRLKGCINLGNLFRGGLKLASQCKSLFHVRGSPVPAYTSVPNAARMNSCGSIFLPLINKGASNLPEVFS